MNHFNSSSSSFCSSSVNDSSTGDALTAISGASGKGALSGTSPASIGPKPKPIGGGNGGGKVAGGSDDLASGGGMGGPGFVVVGAGVGKDVGGGGA